MSCYKICFLSTVYPCDQDVLDTREEDDEKGGGGRWREEKASAVRVIREKP